ncbi:unnamed protein product [Ostreobium quekettii]|uniref:Uncharacterized protein n=1 Tax=Ostreobium quekettii TaxID=121088 RepID=A0A8S1IPB9_9CHLO|nr:unnamed protein product [Ostreobium quekettii]|eukprot:evm.model.scf_1586.3 EVM.evm.TU.scf_1586.3   scf_1586:18383-20656(-)
MFSGRVASGLGGVSLHPKARARVPVGCRAAGGGGEEPWEGVGSPGPSRGFGMDAIGAEYGEGFVNCMSRGWVEKMDVDTINLKLRTRGAQRLRHAMKPDEAVGAVFAFEGVVADTRTLQARSWRIVAEEEGLPIQDIPRPQMLDLPPARAITEVLLWTSDWQRARHLAWRVAEVYSHLFSEIAQAHPGVHEWLAALARSRVPCAVVSSMDRKILRAVLDRLGLREAFCVDVSHEDGMETIAQRYLSAAMKLNRPPNNCVAFSNAPEGIAAAHNCTMKAVAVQGKHRCYELRQADLTCSSLADLSVYNLRRLFANRGSEFMAHQREGSVSSEDGKEVSTPQINIAAKTL